MQELIERLYRQLRVNYKSQAIEEKIKSGEITTIDQVDEAIKMVNEPVTI